MSSTPTPTPVPAQGIVATWTAFVKAHEKLVIIAVSAFLIFHFYGSVINAWVHHDDLAAAKANVQVKTDDVQTIAIQQQLAALQKEIDNQNVLIAQQIAQRNTATQQQVKTDATLPTPDLATRWASLLDLPATDFSASTSGIAIDSDASHVTVEKLEEVPTLTANNAALTTENNNLNQLNSKQQDATKACTTELVDEKTAHTKDVNSLKAANKKSWRNGFKVGAIAGFVGGIFAWGKL